MAKIDITEFKGMNFVLGDELLEPNVANYAFNTNFSDNTLSPVVDYVLVNGEYEPVSENHPYVNDIYIRYESVSESENAKYRFNYGVIDDRYQRSFYVNPQDGYIYYDSFIFRDIPLYDNRINPIVPVDIIEPEVIQTEAGQEAKIVLDKIIGVMAAFIYVPLKLRVVIFGFILFHVINTFQVFNFYKRIIKYAESLPGALGIIGSDILSGLLVNLFLQLIYWVMR